VVPVRGGFVDLLAYESFLRDLALLDGLLQQLLNFKTVFESYGSQLGLICCTEMVACTFAGTERHGLAAATLFLGCDKADTRRTLLLKSGYLADVPGEFRQNYPLWECPALGSGAHIVQGCPTARGSAGWQAWAARAV
jgi:hypothetical protein